MTNKTFYIWHNQMCISYLLRLKQMENFFLANGWKKTNDQSTADCIVIGACAAFLPYFDVYADKLNSLWTCKGNIIVYGCLPTLNRKFYKENTPARATFIPSRFPERLGNLVPEVKIEWSNIPLPAEFRREDYADYDPKKRFILIQEGCSESCVYCPHKLGIGKEKSRSLEEIILQIKNEVTNGATAIVLEGNNGGSWGLDLSPIRNYGDLLKSVLKIPGDFEVHIGDFAAKWVKRYHGCLINPRITDIKIPIQSTSSKLLKVMGRGPYVREMGAFLEKLRKGKRPPFLRTEIIIGFPTSTEKELIETLEFVNKYFDKVSCFSYDYYPSTKITRMNLPFISDEEIERRVKIAINFFKDKNNIIASFDNRGRICAKIT